MPNADTPSSHDTTSHPQANDTGAWLGSFGLTWVLAAVVSTIVLIASGATDPDVETSIPVLAASLVAGWAVYAIGSVLTSRRLGSGDIVSDLGLVARPVDLLGIPLGIVGQLAVIPALYIPLRRIWPDTFSDDALSDTARDLVDRASGGLLPVLVVLVVIGAPLFEELLYRGLLQRPLLDRFPAPVVVVAVAAVFAIIHFRPVEYPGLFAAGLIFGAAAWITGRLGMAFVAHLAFNATGLALAL